MGLLLITEQDFVILAIPVINCTSWSNQVAGNFWHKFRSKCDLSVEMYQNCRTNYEERGFKNATNVLRSLTLPGLTSLTAGARSSQHAQNLHSGNTNSHKNVGWTSCARGWRNGNRFTNSGLWTHQNASGDRAPPGPVGELRRSPRLLAVMGGKCSE